jgi:hypothetical protein
MPIGGIYQLAVNQDLYGVKAANVYHFEQLSDTSPGVRPENSLMEAFLEHMTPLQALMSSEDWTMSCVTSRLVNFGGGPQFIKPDTTPGEVNGQALPASTCCVGSLYSGQGTRKGRGRKFFPGVPKGSTQLGLLSDTGIIPLANFLARLISAIKWTADNADFIIRILSTVDDIARGVVSTIARPRLAKLSGRTSVFC